MYVFSLTNANGPRKYDSNVLPLTIIPFHSIFVHSLRVLQSAPSFLLRRNSCTKKNHSQLCRHSFIRAVKQMNCYLNLWYMLVECKARRKSWEIKLHQSVCWLLLFSYRERLFICENFKEYKYNFKEYKNVQIAYSEILEMKHTSRYIYMHVNDTW